MAETRAQSFEGEIKKCPNCGAVMPSMATKCPECGVELRNTGMSSSLQQFYQDLKDGNDMQDIETISNFPVPNNKEDFLDFLIMAKGEMEKDYNVRQDIACQKHEAWVSKFNQCKAKATLLFASDEKTLTAVNKIIADTKEKKKSGFSKWFNRLSEEGKSGVILGMIILGLILFLVLYFSL